MNQRFYLLVILACFSSVISYAQTSDKQKYIDSLTQLANHMPEDTLKIKVYTRLYEKLMFRDPELSFKYAKKEHDLSVKLNYVKGIASSYLHFADYYKDRGKVDSARYYFNESMQSFQKLNNTRGVMFVNHSLAAFEQSLGNYNKALEYAQKNIALYDASDNMKKSDGKTFNLMGSEYELIGGIHQELGNYDIALNETLKALNFFKNKNDTIRQGDALMQLGTIEYSLKNYESSLNYNKQAYNIYNRFKDLQYEAYSANNIGDSYVALNRFEDAQEYFENALQIATKINNQEIKGNSLVNLGTVFLNLEQLSKARRFLKEGLEIHKTLDYKKTISVDLNELSKVEIKDKQFQKAINYLDESIVISKKINAKNNLVDAYLLRSEAYEKLNDAPMALLDYKVHKAINDSIFNTTKSQQIEKLRTSFETEKKEREIVLQQNEIELLQQTQKAATLKTSFLFTGIISLLIVFSLIYYALRQKMKQHKLVRNNLNKDLEFKTKELTTHALHLAQKNEVLESLKQKVKELKANNSGQGCQQIIQEINFNLQDDNNWENFSRYFEQVHSGFNSAVKKKFPGITTNELRLMALLRMNMSSKEIASILNISNEGVKKARYRLRKKLELESDDSLQDKVLQL